VWNVKTKVKTEATTGIISKLFTKYLSNIPGKHQIKVKQSRYRPGVAQKVRRLHDNGTGWW
jgi:hypothetical protein